MSQALWADCTDDEEIIRQQFLCLSELNTLLYLFHAFCDFNINFQTLLNQFFPCFLYCIKWIRRAKVSHISILLCIVTLRHTVRQKRSNCRIFPVFLHCSSEEPLLLHCGGAGLKTCTPTPAPSSVCHNLPPLLLHLAKLTRLLGSPETRHLADLPTVTPTTNHSLPVSTYNSSVSPSLLSSPCFSTFLCVLLVSQLCASRYFSCSSFFFFWLIHYFCCFRFLLSFLFTCFISPEICAVYSGSCSSRLLSCPHSL